jgi:L-fucose mutarotase/ribose pyranase (RbsD/FucU family)
MKHAAIIILLVAILGSQVARYFIKPTPPPAPDWRAEVKAKLPAFGHRNWIVVADSAYPSQSREGITTIVTGQSQTETLKDVMQLIGECKHVKPLIYEDKELEYVSEDDAKGVLAYRMELKSILKDASVNSEPHESIIAKLDESAKTFNVIILKTDMTLPYTSVFINLDCAYWDDDKQARLKKAMTKK